MKQDGQARAESAKQMLLAEKQATPNVRTFIERLTAAWRELDPEKFRDLVEPGEPTLWFPLLDGPSDVDGLVQYWRDATTAMPDLRVEMRTWASAGDVVFVEWEAQATIGGEPLTWRGTDRFVLEGERAIHERVYTDSHPLRRALARAAASTSEAAA